MMIPPMRTLRYCPSQRSAMRPPKIAASVLIGEPQRFGHVQDEEPPHPVVAEPLPHLREEERGQAAGMPEEAGALGRAGSHQGSFLRRTGRSVKGSLMTT